MTARGRDKRDGARGQILAMTVISLIALCALVGLAADMGFFSDYRRRMQTAADAAAMAGAQHVRRERLRGQAPNLTDVQNEGYKASTSNAFTKDVDGTHVTINWPPLSGPYANDGFVEAIITQPRPTIFMAILGFQSATVTTRAVAGTQDSPNCIYGLRQTASSGGTATNALNFNGGAQVDASCGVVDNFNLSGGGSGGGGNSQLTATSIAVTGSMSGCCFTPTPTTGVPPEPDPLAGRAGLPCPTTCDYGTGTVPLCGSGSLGSGTWTLQPGVYCDGICINSGAQVTFSPGVYVLNGVGLKINGGTVHGTGVTFYNTACSGHTPGSVDISGGPTGALSAPTSGTMKAILFFGDRTVSWSGSSRNNNINGGGTLTLEGTLYFKTTNLTFGGGNSPTGTYTILVADTITFGGISTLRNDFSSLFPDGSPINRVALAE